MRIFRWAGRLLQRVVTLTLLSAVLGAVFFALDKAFLSDAERPEKRGDG